MRDITKACAAFAILLLIFIGCLCVRNAHLSANNQRLKGELEQMEVLYDSHVAEIDMLRRYIVACENYSYKKSVEDSLTLEMSREELDMYYGKDGLLFLQ